jgi:hypothetical protein
MQTTNKHAMWGSPAHSRPKHDFVECFLVVDINLIAQDAAEAGKRQTFHVWNGFLAKSDGRPKASVHRFPSPELDRRRLCSVSVL